MNKIKVECERYMKHTVTDLNDLNEPVMFSNSILRNFFFNTLFGELEVELYPLADLDQKFELLHLTQISNQNCTIADSSTCIEIYSSDCIAIVSSSTNFCVEIIDPNIWTLYFDGFKKIEVAGV